MYENTGFESISGGVAASERPGLSKLLDRLEPGDVLILWFGWPHISDLSHPLRDHLWLQ
jgi:hypothetical protein